jgi:hypothetical protein
MLAFAIFVIVYLSVCIGSSVLCLSAGAVLSRYNRIRFPDFAITRFHLQACLISQSPYLIPSIVLSIASHFLPPTRCIGLGKLSSSVSDSLCKTLFHLLVPPVCLVHTGQFYPFAGHVTRISLRRSHV